MAIAAMFSDGRVRLFATRRGALGYEKSQPDHVFIVGAAEVDGQRHWRGRYPKAGVPFTREDQSTPQLIAAMHNEPCEL